MSILSGLGKFGLGNLEDQNLYEKEKEKVVQEYLNGNSSLFKKEWANIV